MNPQAPRFFAYSTGMLMLSALYYVATHGFYQYVEIFNLEGFFTWFLLSVTIANINYFSSKRFVTKSHESNIFPYVMSVLFVLPICVQIVLRSESGVLEMKPILFAVLFLSAIVGSYLGVVKGKKAYGLRLLKHEEVANEQVEN